MDIASDRPAEGVTVITLTGELDASNFEAVIDAARAAYAGGAKNLVLDLSGLTYMGSSGLVAIHAAAMVMRGQEPPSSEDGWDVFHRMGATVEAAEGRPPVRLAGAQPNVDRILDRTGLKRLFDVHPDRSSALEAIGSAG